MSYLFRVAHSEHLFDFSAEEKIERPTKHHPQLGSKARKLREIDGSPKPPGGETGKVYSKYSGHTGPTPYRRELPLAFINERLERPAKNSGFDIFGGDAAFAQSMLGCRRVKLSGLSIWHRDRVARCPKASGSRNR